MMGEVLAILFFLAVAAYVVTALVRKLGGHSAESKRLRYREGRCVNCGYDIRANKVRCPECGADLYAQALHYWKDQFQSR